MIALGWVDTLRMVWWWSYERRSLDDGDQPGHKRLRILDNGWSNPNYTTPKWGTAKSLINKAKRITENNGFRLERAEIETLEPHVAMPWTTGLNDEAVVYIPLHCHHPKLVLYEDIAAAGLVPGQVWLVGSNTAQRTIANYGDVQSVCLKLTLRKESED